MKRDTTPALCTNRIVEFCTLLCLYRSAEQQSTLQKSRDLLKTAALHRAPVVSAMHSRRSAFCLRHVYNISDVRHTMAALHYHQPKP
jgi:hypothetical protein